VIMTLTCGFLEWLLQYTIMRVFLMTFILSVLPLHLDPDQLSCNVRRICDHLHYHHIQILTP